MRRRFFVDEFTAGKARLSGEAAHHLGRVLRAEPGQLYELSDGNTVHLAQVEHVRPEEVTFSLLSLVDVPESTLHATLLLAIVKFDRFEWALEKAVELGAELIVPLAATRSEPNLLAAAPKRAERWRRIIRESAQQARCRRLPELLPMAQAVDAFRRAPAGQITSGDTRSGEITPREITAREIRILLSERKGAPPLRQAFAAAIAGPHRQPPAPARAAEPDPAAQPVKLSLAVGPEGGWTDCEFAAAAAGAFAEASLGSNILRTETAVAAGLAAAHLYFDVAPAHS